MIAGGSAIAGGGIVARSNYVISRRQAKDVRQGGLRETLVALLSALSQVDQQLRTEPRSKGTVRVINEQMAARFPQVDYITGRVGVWQSGQPGVWGIAAGIRLDIPGSTSLPGRLTRSAHRGQHVVRNAVATPSSSAEAGCCSALSQMMSLGLATIAS
jgi:hypothetical protein